MFESSICLAAEIRAVVLGCSGGASHTAVHVTHRRSGLELTVVALCDSRCRGEDTGPCGLICYLVGRRAFTFRTVVRMA